jgi:alkyl hydroperoxide reductase subunit F
MAIENFISVPHTEGPKLAAHLEQHVKEYDVDVMNVQKAVKLVPPLDGGLAEVQLESGASLKAKTVILSTGARWRRWACPAKTNTATRASPIARTAMARCSRASARR